MKKKALIASLTLVIAVNSFAQGTVNFANRVSGVLVTYVYGPNPNYVWGSQIGNGATDLPSGTTDWTGYTKLSGSRYLAAIMSAPGANAPDAALAFSANTTSFRTGTGAGVLAGITATLWNVAKDAPVATIQVFAWDNDAGTFSDPTAAWNAWKAGAIWGGVSGTFNVAAIGGDFNIPPNLTGLQSFSFYTIPEPTTSILAGIGAIVGFLLKRNNALRQPRPRD